MFLLAGSSRSFSALFVGETFAVPVGTRRHLPALALELACGRASCAGLLSAPERTPCAAQEAQVGQRGTFSVRARAEGGSDGLPWPFASLASQRSVQPSRLIAAACL